MYEQQYNKLYERIETLYKEAKDILKEINEYKKELLCLKYNCKNLNLKSGEYYILEKDLKKKISQLEAKYYIKLGELLDTLSEFKKLIVFYKDLYTLQTQIKIDNFSKKGDINKDNVSRLKKNKDFLNNQQKLNISVYNTLSKKYYNIYHKIKKDLLVKKELLPIIKEKIKKLEKISSKIDTSLDLEKKSLDKNNVDLNNELSFHLSSISKKLYNILFLQQKKENKEFEESIKTKKEILKKLQYTTSEDKLNIYEVKKCLLHIADKFFGNIAETIFLKYPQLYIAIYNVLRLAGIKIFAKSYLALFIFFVVLYISFFILLSLILFLTGNTDKILLVVVLCIFLLIIIILGAYYYPIYIKKEKSKEINEMLPFAIIHMNALANSGIDYAQVFKILAETEEYGKLSEEFKKIVEYYENLGMGLTQAIKLVAEETPSEDLKDFLEDLTLALESGTNIKEYLSIAAESAIMHYKTQGLKFIQTLKTFSDIYVGLVVTTPLILVTMIVLLTSFTDNIFGLPLTTIVNLIVYIGVPIINIGAYLIIDKIQQKT